MLSSLVLFSILSPAKWWSDAVDASLDRAPNKRSQWESMLEEVPVGQRPGADYLVRYMPDGDLRSIQPEYLAENIRLAYEAKAAVPWGKNLPDGIFFDAVLPHANVTEARDPWRKEFMERYLPAVRRMKSPGEAALYLNKTLFKDYKVSYNTRRLRTDQSPRQTIEQGMATCTGLSIMLVDACRAVGVPARLAGIASWPGRGGNHTWVEIWDKEWHFVGAAEPDDKGLNHAWFVGDAATAIKARHENAIWAVNYAPTGHHFPAVWAPDAKIPALNVTDRYTGAKAPGTRLMIEVKRGDTREEVPITVISDSGELLLEGTSLGPTSDINLHLSVETASGTRAWVFAKDEDGLAIRRANVNGDTVVRLNLSERIPDDVMVEFRALLEKRFSMDSTARAEASKVMLHMPWDESFGERAWEAYKQSSLHDSLRAELAAKTVTTSSRTAPYLWRKVGEKPAGGWGLVIAMHGGGGTTQEFNDQQWRGMFERYYKDHPEAGGYIYLALRAPNNEWNGFYDDAICPVVERLIKQFVIAEDVDPNRVYTLGASHGGYGAFVIGPKIPHRFAAVHASASAATDGETKGENLRNVRFSYMIGENDTAYGRAERCKQFATLLEQWQATYGGFDYTFEWLPGVGHSVPDRDKVAEMRKYQRNGWPTKVVWRQSDDVIRHFYWLESLNPKDNELVVASVTGNEITVSSGTPEELAVWLKETVVDFSKPISVKFGESKKEFRVKPSLETYARGLEERGDPVLAAPVRLEIGKSD
ncbi:transglutaminase domain-containing protein [Kamptonema cortianum]|nr:transglutaminase domain-containing protein [Geitlerinema splendidum]MDK3158630.1 transglutaminase domain-containing protein [Kamptonema cortianum]